MEGKGRGGEVRRVHIIYFLSRMGRIEHPHLIRVHHLSRRGIHLQDVKRWLSELRGKDMPDSFSWSYKRRYKTGYVWQDLTDDDLISPISDNEYVLKGSEISSSPSALIDHYSCIDQKARDSSTNPKVPQNPLESEPKQAPPNLLKMDEYSPNKASQSTTEDGSETSSLTDDSIKSIDQVEMKKTTEIIELGDDEDDDEEKVVNNYKKKKDVEEEEEEEVKETMPSRSDFSKSRSKSYSSSGGATTVFRNLLSCRAANTNDSVLMSINKTHSTNNAPIKNKKKSMINNNSSEISRVDKLGGSNRIFCGPWNPKHDASRKSFKESKEKKVSAAYNTMAEPICSQCGKAFKPEKLHSHMRSCRGLKRASGKATMPPLT